ncbi:putative choline kinase 2 [Bidens hawaiensis]|uniref:putative choline kinase 2 n=1 Tax=Bidens hawaiensis TaxID=980011 RepID=UPI004049DB2A
MSFKINGIIEGTQPEGLTELLLSLASDWGDVFDTNKLKAIHLSCALTNAVYQITWPKTTTVDDERTVLVRIYGQVSDIFFDRREEIRTFEFIESMAMARAFLPSFLKAELRSSSMPRYTLKSHTNDKIVGM